MDIEFRQGNLSTLEQDVVTRGFIAHSEEQHAPQYSKERVSWLARDGRDDIVAVLTADILWDWIYIDELWVSSERRGEGLGTTLMLLVEELARNQVLQGIWLWTQSWQGERFYQTLGYSEFARFQDFPRGYSRVGYRKSLN
ncbi:MAG: GNAT family N-acetyltransferase [Haliea sp.]